MANPVKFFREVRQEAAKVTWPSRKETLTTTGLVLAMCAIMAFFFLGVDLALGAAVRWILGIGG